MVHIKYLDLHGKHGEGKVAAVDKSDERRVLKKSRGALRVDANGYALYSKRKNGKYEPRYLHHVIAGKPPKGMIVNHRNSDRLDNTRGNLHVTTYGHNNADRRTANPTGFKGVYKTTGGRFRASRQWQGHQHHLGVYGTAEEASKAYVEFSDSIGEPIHESKITTDITYK